MLALLGICLFKWDDVVRNIDRLNLKNTNTRHKECKAFRYAKPPSYKRMEKKYINNFDIMKQDYQLSQLPRSPSQ